MIRLFKVNGHNSQALIATGQVNISSFLKEQNTQFDKYFLLKSENKSRFRLGVKFLFISGKESRVIWEVMRILRQNFEECSFWKALRKLDQRNTGIMNE